MESDYESTGQSITLTGSTIPTGVTSEGYLLMLSFTTDGSVTRTGFKLSFASGACKYQ